MKKSTGIKMLAFALLAVLATACSKYDEGSKFTLLSKNARMTNTWTLQSYSVDGANQDLLGATVVFDLQKGGTAVLSTSYNGTTLSTDTGTWAFSDDKTNLLVTDSGGNVETYNIIMLKNKDLKLRQTTTILTVDVVEEWVFTGV